MTTELLDRPTRAELVENVLALVRRLLATPADQSLLLDDRLNDLALALWELDNLP